MHRAFVFVLAILAAFVAAAPASAQNVQRIAAVVNDDAISLYDLVARLQMIILTSGVPDSRETRNRLAPQVLRVLIDEKLQMQEAERLSVGVESDEVDTALRTLEGQLNLPQGGIRRVLQQANIPASTIEHQIRAQLAWSKVVALRLRPTVRIGDDEIDDRLVEIRESLGKPQYRAGEIYLSVDTPAAETEIRDRARQLVEEIRGGGNFQALARQFSESAAAASGGDLGWISTDQIPAELASVLVTLGQGEVSDPIRTTDGFYILYVAGRREASTFESVPRVTLQQISLDFGPGMTAEDRQSQYDLAQTVGGVVSGCDDLATVGREMGARVSQRVADLNMSDLAPPIQNAIAGLAEGTASEPIVQERGVLVMMVCDHSGGDGLPSREEVERTLLAEKLDLLARRYLRDLRNSAFVDLRV